MYSRDKHDLDIVELQSKLDNEKITQKEYKTLFDNLDSELDENIEQVKLKWNKIKDNWGNR